MAIFHVTWSEPRRRRIFATRPSLLAAVQALTSCASEHRLLFCIVDDHMHDVLEAEDLTELAPLTSAIHRSMKAKGIELGVPFVREVETRSHLEWLLHYITRQALKHGLREPALWEGSCLLDLLGIRDLPHFDAERIWTHLPRRRPASLLKAYDLQMPMPAAPTDLPTLIEATELAFARPVRLQTRPPRGRAALARLAKGIQTDVVADALGVAYPKSVYRLARRADPEDIHRVRLAAGLIGAVRAAR